MKKLKTAVSLLCICSLLLCTACSTATGSVELPENDGNAEITENNDIKVISLENVTLASFEDDEIMAVSEEEEQAEIITRGEMIELINEAVAKARAVYEKYDEITVPGFKGGEEEVVKKSDTYAAALSATASAKEKALAAYRDCEKKNADIGKIAMSLLTQTVLEERCIDLANVITNGETGGLNGVWQQYEYVGFTNCADEDEIWEYIEEMHLKDVYNLRAIGTFYFNSLGGDIKGVSEDGRFIQLFPSEQEKAEEEALFAAYRAALAAENGEVA